MIEACRHRDEAGDQHCLDLST